MFTGSILLILPFFSIYKKPYELISFANFFSLKTQVHKEQYCRSGDINNINFNISDGGGGVALSSGVLFNEILNFNLKNIKV